MALKSQSPDIKVIGVQAVNAAAYPASLAAGSPQKLDHMSTMADGIAVGLPGDIPFEIVNQHVDEIMTVTEDQLSSAALLLLERAKMVVEPAGAAATAAVMAWPKKFEAPVAVGTFWRQCGLIAFASHYPTRHGRERALHDN